MYEPCQLFWILIQCYQMGFVVETLNIADCSISTLIVSCPDFFNEWRSQYSGIWLRRFDLLAESPETAVSGVRAVCAVGQTTGQVLGVALVETPQADLLRIQAPLWISYVWVPEKWRRTGVAFILITHIWDNRTTNWIALCSARSSEDESRNLYARAGFRQIRPGSFMMSKGEPSAYESVPIARGMQASFSNLKASDMGAVSMLLRGDFLEFAGGRCEQSSDPDPEELYSRCLAETGAGGLLGIATTADTPWLLWAISVNEETGVRAAALTNLQGRARLYDYRSPIYETAMRYVTKESSRRHHYLPPRY